MNLPSSRLVLRVTTVGAVAFILVRGVGAQGQVPRIPLVSDWSHRHVVYSRPASWVKAWKLEGEQRYWQHAVRRTGRGRGPIESDFGPGRFGFPGFDWRQRRRETPIQRDWGQSLGAGGSTGAPLAGSTWYPVYPAKFSFDVNAAPNCINDFVAFPTNLTGATGGQASIIAYNNLYVGSLFAFCTGPASSPFNPSVYWSYNTNFDATGGATNGTIQTSPVISIDGTKLAFVENRTNANGGSILHLLKWRAGDGGAINTAAAPVRATAWTADGAPGHCPVTGACLISLVLNGAQADTGSSPFYDYTRDTLYVGDDNGVLHKFSNVFGLTGETPGEVVTGNWPITVNAGRILTSPILDGVSGNIFTGDSSGRLSYLRETFSSAGVCFSGTVPCLGSTNIAPGVPHVIADAPIVDPVTEKVFVFFGNNGTSAAVVQSDITLSASVTASLGSSGIGHHVHSGAFDNAYLTGNGSAGRLYMCGSSASSLPTIQRIGFSNSSATSPFANPIGTMNAAVDGVTLTVASAAVECAPLTEFFNASAPASSQDQIFFGVQNSGSGANCGGGGCVMAINVTGTPSSLSIGSSIAEVGGPSGIIVDNNANPNTGSFPQASSLYFSRQGDSTVASPCGFLGPAGVGCAVKVTQAALN
jgi:hypothetical protein